MDSRRMLWLVTAASVLAACGGGHSGASSKSDALKWTPGVYQPQAMFANQCAAPRSGTDPFTGQKYPDRTGSVLAENHFLRAWTHDVYLWYSEVADRNPAGYTDPVDYFDVLKTAGSTASGNPKDKFHFTYDTAAWESLALNGTQAGYGAYFVIINPMPPRLVRVGYVESGSPAAGASPAVMRGEQVISVDGAQVLDTDDVDTLNAGLFPSSPGESHTFVLGSFGASTPPRTVTLVSTDVTLQPVQNVHTIDTQSGAVGYMLFNDHLATSEAALVDAFNTLAQAHVTDLVLDIRYNGGGYLDIASEVAYMIAGAARTQNQTFDLLQFNDQHPTVDPVTGDPITPTEFHSLTQGFSATAGQPLPTLDLPRVFVLTTGDTCSASESILNGLQGVDVQVIQIGTTTCGKPYGFYPQDNCGTTYFSIEFRGLNAKGFGEYSDGFGPSNAATSSSGTSEFLPGCYVQDDFAHALGDSSENLLATALAYRQGTAGCHAFAGASAAALKAGVGAGLALERPPWMQSRIRLHTPRRL